jgi:LysR family hydrogen peroxide-inducible transcriptional activator
MVASIPFENPPPLRRVALAWRRSSVHEQVVAALVVAVHGMNKPAYMMIAPDA